MAKIISITDTVVSIGTDNGGIKEVRACDLNFVPHVGDEVEIFETDQKTIVSKLEKKPEVQTAIPNGGININLTNTQTQQTNQTSTIATAPDNAKVVNKVVYCVLAFFLGGFGAHKFYAGKIGSGIAYLLFFWTAIPALIAFFEFLGALFKKADAAGNIIV